MNRSLLFLAGAGFSVVLGLSSASATASTYLPVNISAGEGGSAFTTELFRQLEFQFTAQTTTDAAPATGVGFSDFGAARVRDIFEPGDDAPVFEGNVRNKLCFTWENLT